RSRPVGAEALSLVHLHTGEGTQLAARGVSVQCVCARGAKKGSHSLCGLQRFCKGDSKQTKNRQPTERPCARVVLIPDCGYLDTGEGNYCLFFFFPPHAILKNDNKKNSGFAVTVRACNEERH
ncbi:hypothetical protein AAFF_G00237380, partial [Aldrovandia affinis]